MLGDLGIGLLQDSLSLRVPPLLEPDRPVAAALADPFPGRLRRRQVRFAVPVLAEGLDCLVCEADPRTVDEPHR